jgi:hypothetical protein
MTDYKNKIIGLSKSSRFADIDLEAISKAISLALRQVSDKTSYEDVVTQAIANLPDGITSFERGFVSGIVLAQMTDFS